jgi:hypothetical protein
MLHATGAATPAVKGDPTHGRAYSASDPTLVSASCSASPGKPKGMWFAITRRRAARLPRQVDGMESEGESRCAHLLAHSQRLLRSHSLQPVTAGMTGPLMTLHRLPLRRPLLRWHRRRPPCSPHPMTPSAMTRSWVPERPVPARPALALALCLPRALPAATVSQLPCNGSGRTAPDLPGPFMASWALIRRLGNRSFGPPV